MTRTCLLALLMLLLPARSWAQGVGFSASHEAVAAGEMATVSIAVERFVAVTTAQFTLEWDPGVVTYQSTRSYNLEGLGSANFGTTNVTSGHLSFSWDDPGAVGVTVPDGTVIFTVTFETVGASGETSAVVFSDTPTLREVTVNFATVAFDQLDGSVTLAAAEQYVLSVTSVDPASGVSIVVTPSDAAGNGSGTTPFERRYVIGSVVSLTAPAVAEGHAFVHWLVGGSIVSEEPTVTVTMSGSRLAEAVFETPSTAAIPLQEIPRDHVLRSVYPNPFRSTTSIGFDLSYPDHVSIDIYDGMGRRVRALVSAFLEAGAHSVIFDAGSLAGGIYLCRMQTGSKVAVTRLVLTR